MSRRVAWLAFVFVGLPGCSGGGTTSLDTGILDSLQTDPGTDSWGSDAIQEDATDAKTPFPDGATAWVAKSEADLIGGPMAAGVPGDVVLKNRYVRFVVRSQPRSLYSPYPGALVDADVTRPPGEAGNDQFFEAFPMIGLGRVFAPTKMEIVDDGLYSGTAVVRFTGRDGGIPIIDSILSTAAQSLEATIDYVLGPEARHLEIRTTVRNAATFSQTVNAGLVVQLGRRLAKFHDGCGTDQDCLATATGTRWVGGAADDVSYAVTLPAPDTIAMLLAVGEMMVLQTGTFDLDPGGSASVTQYLVVGNGTVEDAASLVRKIRGEPDGTTVDFQVALSDTVSNLEDVVLRVRTAGEGGAWVTATRPGKDGKATVRLKPGKYDVVASLPGAKDATVSGISVGEAPGAPVAITANPSGRLHVRVTDDQGKPVHASLTLQSGHGADLRSGVVRYEAIHDGDRTIVVAPGEYTATVARGLSWTLDRQDITVPSGKTAELAASIAPAYDTTGFLALNTHEHTERSPDSSVTVEDRVFNALANGIDLMLATDHDFFGTRQPDIERLGVQDRVAGFAGCEVSPLWGHTTAGGCRNPPPYPTYYAVDFVFYDDSATMTRPATASEIFHQARDQFQCDFLAVNHPYRDEGMFVQFHIDGTANPALAEPDLDLHLVDGLEVYNKSDSVESILANSLPAWFNLLNRGYAMVAVGGSDEHGYAGSYGSPRNLVRVSKKPGDAGLHAAVFDSLKAGRSLVLGGPFVALTVDGAGMGETVSAPDKTVQVRLVVKAPAWMQLSFVRVYANGAIVHEATPADTTDVIRVDETFDLPLLADSHIVAAAGSLLSDHVMTPVSPRPPFSVTNPVFVDVDGGGYVPIYKDGAPWD